MLGIVSENFIAHYVFRCRARPHSRSACLLPGNIPDLDHPAVGAAETWARRCQETRGAPGWKNTITAPRARPSAADIRVMHLARPGSALLAPTEPITAVPKTFMRCRSVKAVEVSPQQS
jgi:hypothetical protein